MFSVSTGIYNALAVGSRWLFAFIALLLLLFAYSWFLSGKKQRRERLRNLPGAGTIGELIVISGSDELPPDTWFPVPREGVLGSLRSCDLVVPCPGVRARHLDFSWQDGTGLLIRPRSGCEALVDGNPADRRTPGSVPLIHGSFLQVGSAVLRLQLFSALDHTNRPVIPGAQPAGPAQPVPFDPAMPETTVIPSEPSMYFPPVQEIPLPPSGQGPAFSDPSAVIPESQPEPEALPETPGPAPQSPETGLPSAEPAPAARRRRRSDRWKEDWSE